jgi:hypothetical protein
MNDRKTRDAVRSVLELITGGTKAPAPEAAAPAGALAADASRIEGDRDHADAGVVRRSLTLK